MSLNENDKLGSVKDAMEKAHLGILREQNKLIDPKRVNQLIGELKRIVENWDEVAIGRPTSPQLVLMCLQEFLSETNMQKHT